MSAAASLLLPGDDSALDIWERAVRDFTRRVSPETLPTALVDPKYDWPRHARPSQLPPPGDWSIWLIMAGRGWGKTRTAAEYIRTEVMAGRMRSIALVSDTVGDVRQVMVENKRSGLLAIHPPHERPVYEPSKRKLTWPNGAEAYTYSAEDPEQLRGPEHDGFWADEPGKWRPGAGDGTWDNLMLGFRLEAGSGARGTGVATTTPRRTRLMRSILAEPGVMVTGGSTYENRDNLAAAFFERIRRRFEGTNLGRQELEGVLLEEVEGALWTLALIEKHRLPVATSLPDLVRVVIGVDPNASSAEGAAECGIVAAGKDSAGHGYVLADESVAGRPDRWANRVIDTYLTWQADKIIAEANNGGEMVEEVIRVHAQSRGLYVPVEIVRASRGKMTRAEPVASLYATAPVHHVGLFGDLEDQLTTWTPEEGDSPDRLDALVWALTELMLGNDPTLHSGPIPPLYGARPRETRSAIRGHTR